MQFGGMQKMSLIDYPDQVAAVVFTVGCNFRCPYCHNPELVRGAPDPAVDRESVLEFLRPRRGFLDALVVSGGEPTLQEDLLGFMAEVKDMGYLVKLDTNGSRPAVLAEVLRRGLADYVAMDVKTAPSRYAEALGARCGPAAIRESIRTLLAWDGEYEFRTTCLSPLVDGDVVDLLAAELSGARRWALQRFVPDRVLDPEYVAATARPVDHGHLLEYQAAAVSHVGECVVRD